MHTEINSLSPTEISPKKRVLFIITQSEMGGAQKFLHTLATRLDRTKFDMLVAAGPGFSSKNKAVSSKYDLLDLLERDGIKILRLKYLQREINLFYDIGAIFELKKILREFKPDTLFLLSSKAGFIGSLTASYLLHTTHPKVVYRIGGWTFNDPWPRWKKLFWIFLERLSAKWKDTIIVNNKHDFDQSKILKIKPRSEVKLIYNGLDVYKIDFLNREEGRIKLFEKTAKPSGRVFDTEIVVGTIANFYPTKGLEYLIEAAEHFKNDDNIVFIIIGDGTKRPYLEKLITDKNLEEKVLLLGQLPDAYRLLPAFDIFALSSIKEGFPWVVIEAMAAKLPVIATKVGAMPEIMEDGANGMLVEPAHPEQMAKKIQELINNEHLRRELGIQGHQTVLFKFSLDKMVSEVESLL